jgi:hypothetical protein
MHAFKKSEKGPKFSMNKVAKKVIGFVVGGCLFSIMASLAMLFVQFNWNITGQAFEIEKDGIVGNYVLIFVFGGIIWLICSSLFQIGAPKTASDRKKVIKNQMILYGIFLIAAVILLIVSIIKSIPQLIILSTVSILAIVIVEVGCYLANKILKQDVELINEKLKEKINN